MTLKEVKEWVVMIFGWIWEFIHPFVDEFASQLGKELLAAALQAVMMVQQTMTEADGAAKRAAAFKKIVEDLAAKGLIVGEDIAEHMINTAIEMALLKLKSDQTPVVEPEPAPSPAPEPTPETQA